MHDYVLPRTSPEQQGVSSAALLNFVTALEEQMHDIHSFMLLRHGNVIAEGWWQPYEHTYPHMLYSLSKSFTSTAVGLALAEGRFSIDDTVTSFFPEETPAQVSEFLAVMRVRDLLSMTTGHADDTWAFMDGKIDVSWIKAFLEVPVQHAPGTHFLYNTGATYMLSAIVQKTTGLNLVDYLRPRLFEPLGIENATWQESPEGIKLGGIGLSLKTEDVARFGQLYLQKGQWQDRQILPEVWVEEATSRIATQQYGATDWTQGYGYQFWRCRHGAYRGDGVFGQFCIVMPEQDAVLVITAGIDVFDSQQPLDLLWEIVLPAMQPDSLPENTEAYEGLMAKLSHLSIPPVPGQATSPVASQISGRTYRVDSNDLRLEMIAFHFTASSCTLDLTLGANEETIPCSFGSWQQGNTSLFQDGDITIPAPIATSGAWTAEETYKMVVRLYETPFYHEVAFHFVGDELMIETQVNVSLDAIKPLLLTARSG